MHCNGDSIAMQRGLYCNTTGLLLQHNGGPVAVQKSVHKCVENTVENFGIFTHAVMALCISTCF